MLQNVVIAKQRFESAFYWTESEFDRTYCYLVMFLLLSVTYSID